MLSVPRRIRPILVNTSNPLFVHDFARCIRCGRCVRACNELRGAGVLQLKEEGGEITISIPDDKTLGKAGCRFCGVCVEVCPTGAMRDKEELVRCKKRVDPSLKGALGSLSSSNIWDFAVVNYFICYMPQLSYILAQNDSWLSINNNQYNYQASR